MNRIKKSLLNLLDIDLSKINGISPLGHTLNSWLVAARRALLWRCIVVALPKASGMGASNTKPVWRINLRGINFEIETIK